MKISILGAPGTGKTQLASELARHFQAQADTAQVFISDDTPLLAAVYSDLLSGDRSLYDSALEQQRRYDLTLLTGLDLPAVTDDRPREAVDALLRAALGRAGIAFTVVYGSGPERSANALKRMGIGGQIPIQDDGLSGVKQYGSKLGSDPQYPASQGSPWTWSCDKCSDPACEHRLFTGKLKIGSR